MRTQIWRRCGAIVALALMAVLAACGSDTATTVSQPTATATPDPKTIAQNGADTLQAATAFHFTIKVSGSPQITPGVGLDAAEGDVVKPDKVKASMNVTVGGTFKLQSEAVGVGSDSYFLNPLTKKYEKMPADWGFKPQTLSDPDKGLSSVVRNAQNITLAGSEAIDGVDSYHLTGTVAGAVVAPISANTLGKYPVLMDLWVGKSDSQVRQIKMHEIIDGAATPAANTTPTAGAAVPADWLMHLSKFGETIDIQKPAGV